MIAALGAFSIVTGGGMRTGFIVFVSVFGATLAGVKYHGRMLTAARQLKNERWVNANHLRVMSGGVWQDVELMPLADHLCQSRQPMFLRYCSDPS